MGRAVAGDGAAVDDHRGRRSSLLWGEADGQTDRLVRQCFAGCRLRAGKMFLVAGGSGSGLPGVVGPPQPRQGSQAQAPRSLLRCALSVGDATEIEDAFFTGQQSEPRQAEREKKYPGIV